MSNNIHPVFDRMVTREERENRKGQKAGVLWLTGLSGSGKSTLGIGLERHLFNEGFAVQMLDGDNIRTGICSNLGFSVEDRAENIRRIAEIAKLFVQNGAIVICSFISPTREIRKMARDIIGAEDFFEVFVNTPLEVCERRDVKGLYKKARAGEIKGFTGIDSPYEAPLQPDLEILTQNRSLEASLLELVQFILPKIQPSK